MPNPAPTTTAHPGTRRRRRTRGSARSSRRAARSRTRSTCTACARATRCPSRSGIDPRSTPSVARPAGHFDPLRLRRRAGQRRLIVRRRDLLLERQPMPHVQQRFLVHRFVLEDRERGFGAVEERMPGSIEVGVLRARRAPDGRLRRRTARTASREGQSASRRLAPALRPRSRADRSRARRAPRAARRCSAAQRALHECVEAERRQMAFVEDNRMTKRDRPTVVGLVGEQVEDLARPQPVAAVTVDHVCQVGSLQDHPRIFIPKPRRCRCAKI